MIAWRQWAKALRRDVLAVWIAARHPRLPWGIKLLAAAVAAYALSPIDLIPDVIPVLGHLDDVVIVPLGIMLVVHLMPADVLAECRAEADRLTERPAGRAGLAIMIVLWILAAVAATWLAWPYLAPAYVP
jgi:uncharacterized membrane protein YkvA (DUF1232 family)